MGFKGLEFCFWNNLGIFLNYDMVFINDIFGILYFVLSII